MDTITHQSGSPWAARFYDSRYPVPNDRHAVIRNRSLVAASVGYLLDSPLDYGVRAAALSASWLPQTQYVVLLTATSRTTNGGPTPTGLPSADTSSTKASSACCRWVMPSNCNVRSTLPGVFRGCRRSLLGIPALASLLSGAQRVVGVDTGLTHLAAALGRPHRGHLLCLRSRTDRGIRWTRCGQSRAEGAGT